MKAGSNFICLSVLLGFFLASPSNADYSRPYVEVWPREAYRDETDQTNRYRTFNYSPDTVFDSLTRLIWEQVQSQQKFTWNDKGVSGSAQAYCATLNKGGYSHWRVPNVMELQSLLHYSEMESDRVHKIFSVDSNQEVSWTSVKQDNSTVVLGFRMSDGVLETRYMTDTLPVRCVTGFTNAMSLQSTNSVPGYIVGGNISFEISLGRTIQSTVRLCDGITRICWAPKSFQCVDYSEAEFLCASTKHFLDVSSSRELIQLAEQLGPISWRLPTVKELVTLVDYKSSKFRINETVQAGLDLEELYYWASTPQGENFNSRAVISLKSGLLSFMKTISGKSSKCVLARCVDRF